MYIHTYVLRTYLSVPVCACHPCKRNIADRWLRAVYLRPSMAFERQMVIHPHCALTLTQPAGTLTAPAVNVPLLSCRVIPSGVHIPVTL